VVERKLEMVTDSELSLPRGTDPLVLGGLLTLLFEKASRPTTSSSGNRNS
jgi:hypothetical protein